MHAEARKLSKTKSIAGVLLLASIIGVAPLAVTAQQQQQAVSNRLSGHVSYARTSPPGSGVRLLEDIFQRVRSAPQIAMAKNLYKQQMDIAQQAQQSGPTDYRLAIRPKRLSGKNAGMPSASLQLIPAEANYTDSLSAAFGNSGTGSALIAQNAEPVPESWLGNRQFPVVPKDAGNKKSGLWESPAQSKKEADLSQTRGVRIPDLATATGRLFGVTKAIQEAERFAEQAEVQSSVTPQTRSRSRADQIAYNNEVRASRDAAADGDSFAGAYADEEKSTLNSNARNNLARREQQPLPLKAKAKPSATPAASPMAGFFGGAGGAQSPTTMGKLLNQGGDKADYNSNSPAAPGAPTADEKMMNRAKLAMGDIALLPPNVVTGIPLVRLGTSETQASSALQQIGNMKQLKVNKWTVWTWNRPTNKTGTSLQLYVRNGLLDAMRIFDPGLIGPDFGVTLGDSLARVKERFGEPAFILQEPGPGAGQNYIYPISQIGFQLARPAPNEPPRVVSVLIFNVK